MASDHIDDAATHGGISAKKIGVEQKGREARLPRRRLLQGAAAATLAAPAIVGLGPGTARAANREIFVPGSGGPYLKNLQHEIVAPFTKQTGIHVHLVPGSFEVQGLKLLASRGKPPFDAYLGGGDDFVKLIAANKMMKMTTQNVPNLADVYPKFKDPWDGYGCYFDYDSIGIACRTDKVKKPPASWRELIDRTAAGDFGHLVFWPNLPSGVRGPEILMTLSRVFAGKPEDIDAGFAAIKRIKPYIFKFYTAFSDPVIFLQNGEGIIGPGYDGRTFVAEDQTHGEIKWIDPAEGPPVAGPIWGVVRGGNEEAAFAWVNYALGAEAQKAFCEAMLYGSVNSKVHFDTKRTERIPKPTDVHMADERFIAEHLGSWTDRWNREIL